MNNTMDNKAFSKIWIVVIILVVLIGGGILAWQYFKIPRGKIKAPEKVSQMGTAGGGGGVSMPGPANDGPAEGWTTYRNEGFGYEVKYPKGWYKLDTSIGEKKGIYNVAFSTNSTGRWAGEGKFALIYIAREKNFGNLPIEQWYESLPEEDKTTHRYITVNGIKSIEADGAMGHSGKIVFIPDKDKIYVYDIRITTKGSRDEKEELENIFHHVVSTFKFIK